MGAGVTSGAMDRRSFGAALAGGLAWRGGAAAPPPAGAITDVAGIKVGHFTDSRRPTGCTVVLCEAGAVAGVDVRGGAPGTRETDLLDPVMSVQVVHGVVLAGGSAFGLDAASGVVRFLEERGVGFATGAGKVPIVPAAILYDLGLGDPRVRPDAAAGHSAAASAAAAVVEGSVGAGAGATVGKAFGSSRAMKGGLGTASLRTPAGLVVGALVAVNAIGDVRDPETGRLLAGARTLDGRSLEGTMRALREGRVPAAPRAGESTSIGVVATNARLDKAQATKVAQMAHDGLARAVEPAHTPWDGDTLFALATGEVSADLTAVGALAAAAVAQAIVRAVLTARGVLGILAASELAP
jgi:L-aminopeptidase/D-esterase-like protein